MAGDCKPDLRSSECRMMIPLLRYTNWGLYAVAGTSTILLTTKDLFFQIPFIAKLVKVNPWYFWKYVVKYAVSAASIILNALLVKTMIPVSSWPLLILDAAIVGCIACIVNCFLLLDQPDRDALRMRLMQMVRRKR